MVEAVDHLRLLITSILDIYKVSFNDTGINMNAPLQHYYTGKVGSDFGNFWSLVEWK